MHLLHPGNGLPLGPGSGLYAGHGRLLRMALMPWLAGVRPIAWQRWRRDPRTAWRESRLRARLQRYVAEQQRHRQLLLAVQLLYAALVAGWLVFAHSWPAPDVLAMFLLLFALLMARGVGFLRDWSPFVLLLLGYIALTGIVGGLTARAHLQFPIDADRSLFSRVPTIWLQRHLYHPGQPRWYDYGATLLYPLHFVAPLALAFVLWTWLPRFYWRFVSAYLLLCYAAFVTYLLYPMAPPWWAYAHGRLPTVHLILYEVHYGGVHNPIALATQFFRPNPVAAMPSLHAAVPVLIWLTAKKVWPRWGQLLVAYPLAMGAAVVYLGEHYAIDVLVGAAYAIVVHWLVWGDWRGPWAALRRRSHRPSTPFPLLPILERRGDPPCTAQTWSATPETERRERRRPLRTAETGSPLLSRIGRRGKGVEGRSPRRQRERSMITALPSPAVRLPSHCGPEVVLPSQTVETA